MKHLMFFILLVAFSSQLSAISSQQTSCTVPEPVEGTAFGASTSSATAYPTTVDGYPMPVDYYENQIRLADSLYKNYLLQYNFDEVKAAMEFFDSCQLSAISRQRWRFFDRHQPSAISGQRWRLFDKEADDENRLIAESRQLTAAKAHYYHAVGLTERDDIVGACEHYLTALEIMESETENLKTSKSEKGREQRAMSHEQKFRNAHSSKLEAQSPDYEKIRFIALTYTRLGRLFYNENYCDLAILKYRKALEYIEYLGNNEYKANILKELGNVYQLNGESDSALYYYNSSLKANPDLTNKLDLEKNIAQILFDKGEKDSAYIMIKSNLEKLDNYRPIDSYYGILGIFYHEDEEYDSAIYYLGKCSESTNNYVKIASSIRLSAIYDSIGDYEKKAYYDNIISDLSVKRIKRSVKNNQLQDVYDKYKERKAERISIEAKARTRRITIISCLGAIIAIMFVFVYVRYNYKKQNDRLKGEINDYANENKRLIDDFKKSNNKKDKIIDKQKKEIDRIKTRISKKNVNIEAYYASDICKKILSRKDNDFSSLKEDELALLLKSADEHLDNISERLRNKFPSLNKNDIYTICLLILNVEKGKLQYLLGKDRKTIWNRLNKIKSLMNVDENHDLFLHIKDNFLN